uniref:Chemokine interleukin-8-like domain-containing protein n=1 Tax=Cyprinus carpio TaxID=7962 RepID=A0A8C1QNM0_CYPCA
MLRIPDTKLKDLRPALCLLRRPAEGELDAIPSCCLRVSKYIRREDLHSVSKYEIQHKSGVCEIDAVVLHIRKKLICADLRVLPRLKRLKKNHKPKRA